MSLPQYSSREINNHSTKSSSKSSVVLSGKKLEETFKAATDTIQNLPKNGSFQPSNELLLKFYGYFKQSTNGPCDKPRPGMFKVVERAKWDAWNSVKSLSKEEAMNAYIEEIKNIVETMPHNETVQKFLDILGPFYEYVDENNETINNNDRNLSDLNEQQHQQQQQQEQINNDQSLIITEKLELLKQQNGQLIQQQQNNNNNYVNGTNGVGVSDDEEDFCDTNDNIDTIQAIKILKSKINNNNQNGFNNNNYQNAYMNGGSSSSSGLNNNMIMNGNGFYNGNGGLNHDAAADDSFEEVSTAAIRVQQQQQHNGPITMTTDIQNDQPFINQYGGESTQSAAGGSYSLQSHRPSRPSSTHSNIHRTPSNLGGSGGNGIGGGSGSAGGGYPPPNDPYLNINYLNNDSNRQILLLLMRLQQDTNNVLTRLSYLEATVMSIQNNLQMNRIENTIQATQSRSPGLVNGYSNGGHLTPSRSLWSYITTNINIDWKTVFVAIIGPLVIRLVFLVFRKIKLVIKLRKSRRLL